MSCLSQMQQLGNMKNNFDDLSDPEQFACLVSSCFNFFFSIDHFHLTFKRIQSLTLGQGKSSRGKLTNQDSIRFLTLAKRGKTCSRCQAREKYATSAKRGKTCSRCQAREKHATTAVVPSAGKRGQSKSLLVLIMHLIGWRKAC